MEHTKGPWKPASDYQPLLIVSQDKTRVADCTPALGASKSEAFANASLITAAPDLLAACQLVLDECQDILYAARLEVVTAEIKKAVAKARGGE